MKKKLCIHYEHIYLTTLRANLINFDVLSIISSRLHLIVSNLGFHIHTYAAVQCVCTQISNRDTYCLKDQGAREDFFGV